MACQVTGLRTNQDAPVEFPRLFKAFPREVTAGSHDRYPHTPAVTHSAGPTGKRLFYDHQADLLGTLVIADVAPPGKMTKPAITNPEAELVVTVSYVECPGDPVNIVIHFLKRLIALGVVGQVHNIKGKP